ncbi:hypothetical protein Cgig2_010107 [Carnegiea gigantea]|uniref:Poly(A) RNA polymerase mitochondrial-like central palm domain-containing protein n=1 Tax=Carnegiea gigantea TaxID=171969 RepID=A0A9Q1K6J4_9CARY|nr:hypothetical protein Cgig2_010107 [Carnegiea gigantea]
MANSWWVLIPVWSKVLLCLIDLRFLSRDKVRNFLDMVGIQDLHSQLPLSSRSSSFSSTLSDLHPSSNVANKWMVGENITEQILSVVQPTVGSEKRRGEIIEYIQTLIEDRFGIKSRTRRYRLDFQYFREGWLNRMRINKNNLNRWSHNGFGMKTRPLDNHFGITAVRRVAAVCLASAVSIVQRERERERERERAVRSPVIVAWDSNAVFGSRRLPLHRPPVVHCSDFRVHQVSFSDLVSGRVGFSSAEGRAELVGGLCLRRLPLRWYISRRRLFRRSESRRIFAGALFLTTCFKDSPEVVLVLTVKMFILLQVFPFGSVPLKTYLPHGDVDLTAVSHYDPSQGLAADICNLLQNEEKSNTKIQVRDVLYVPAQVRVVKCTVDDIAVDISFNQTAGLCALCFLEQVKLEPYNHPLLVGLTLLQGL